jgi:predicted dehydrogenase
MRVGVIGASPERGWALKAHIPALRATPGFELVAVSTSRDESARQARELFGTTHAFSNYRDLVALPEVDLVVITVKVAAHAELVRAALSAGKQVYCEWPLALTSEEAVELEEMARATGVPTALGLQARYSPGFAYARELIRTGYVGRVTSAQLVSSRSKGSSVAVPEWSAYTYQESNAAGLVEVLGGHALDLVEHLLGPITSVSRHATIQHPAHTVAETGAPVEVTAADHLDVIGEVGDGAALSVHLRDGGPGTPRTQLTVNGTEGSLVVDSVPEESPWAAQIQIAEHTLTGYPADERTGLALPIPDRLRTTPAGLSLEAASVARVYQRLSSGDVPDFTTGVRIHRLLTE